MAVGCYISLARKRNSSGPDVRIKDRVSKVAVYVAAANPNLREQLESRRRELLQFEESFQFDPAGRDADFKSLAAFPAQGGQ